MVQNSDQYKANQPTPHSLNMKISSQSSIFLGVLMSIMVAQSQAKGGGKNGGSGTKTAPLCTDFSVGVTSYASTTKVVQFTLANDKSREIANIMAVPVKDNTDTSSQEYFGINPNGCWKDVDTYGKFLSQITYEAQCVDGISTVDVDVSKNTTDSVYSSSSS